VARRGDQEPTRRPAIAAAAQRINLADRREAAKYAVKPQSWHPDAWDAFDEVPEVGESLTYRADQLAKLRLYAAVANPDDPEGDPIPLTDERAACPPAVQAAASAEVARLRTPMGGQAEILRRYSLNIDVAGDLWLVGFAAREPRGDGDPGEPECWNIHSTDEIREEGGEFTVLDRPGDTTGRKLTADDFCSRIWRPHPRWALLPWSPLYHLRTDSRVVITLNQQVISESLSTQPAGILLVPNEIEFKWPKGITPPEDDPTADPFMAILEQAIMAAVASFGDAASQFPLVIRGAAEHLKPDVLRHLSLARTPDTNTEDRIRARVERIARGLPLPVEKVMGHQQTTYANAYQVDRDEFTDYLQPTADAMMTTLGYVFLTPHLHENEAVTDGWADRIVLGYDASTLFSDPDPADSADFGLREGVVRPASWRAAKGWTEDDAPDPLELLARLGFNRGAVDPAMTAELLADAAAAAGLDLTPAEAQAMAEASPAEAAVLAVVWQAARARGMPPPGIRPRPVRARQAGAVEVTSSPVALTAGTPRPLPLADAGARLTAIDRDLRARLVAAADSAMGRVLEKAGNQLRNVARKHQVTAALSCPPDQVAGLLGRGLVAAAGADVLDEPAVWEPYRRQFMAWGDRAQGEARELAGRVAGGFTSSQRSALQLRQADDLDTAWKWLQGQMGALSKAQLFDPTGIPHDPLGEFDPTSRVPTGLLRQALAIAGGSPLQVLHGEQPAGTPQHLGEAWISPGTEVPGGVAAGPRILGAMRDAGVEVHAYRWVYGPALRAHPFLPHLALDGLTFESFTSDQLQVVGGFPPRSHYLPGDHVGCVCDVEPLLRAMQGGDHPEAPKPLPPTPPPAPKAKRVRKAAGPVAPPLPARTVSGPVAGADVQLQQLLARHVQGTWNEARDPAVDALVDRTASHLARPELGDLLRSADRDESNLLDLVVGDPAQWSERFVARGGGGNTHDSFGLLITEPVDAARVAARARETVNWARYDPRDPIIMVNLGTDPVTGGSRPVIIRGAERLLAALEQGVESPRVRELRSDLFADVLGDPQLIPESARGAAFAAAVDIAAESQAAAVARREALGPIPPDLKTGKAVTEAFLDRWGDRGVGKPPVRADFSNMPANVAYEVADQLDILMRAHPEVADTVRTIGTPTFVKDHLPGGVRLRGMGSNTWADATDIGTLRFNPSYFGKAGAAMKRGQGMATRDGALTPHLRYLEASRGEGVPRIGFHVDLGDAEVSNARGIVTHEFGHLIDFHARKVMDGSSRAMGEVYRRQNLYVTQAGELGQSRTETIMVQLSRYAAKNSQETMAEATTQALLSSNPSQLATNLYQLIRDAARGRLPDL